MKVIVFQTLLDLGIITDKIFPTGKPDESILIISTCMKSVKSWCRKNGYEYVLCEENLNWNYDTMTNIKKSFIKIVKNVF